jgi:hypothetical protein
MTPRKEMTVRIVPLGSHEGQSAPIEGSVPERVAVVGELTKAGWAIAQMPMPDPNRGPKSEGKGEA